MRSLRIVICWLLLTTVGFAVALARVGFAQEEPGAPPTLSPPPPTIPPPPPQPQPLPFNEGEYQQVPPAPGQMMPFQPGVMPLEEMPEFRAGKRRRLAGILVTSIGTGLGAVFASMGLLLRASCGLYGCDESGNGLMIGGLIGMGASLAVGIPLWVSGQRQVREARDCWSAQFTSSLGIAPTEGGLQLSSRWRF